MKDLWKAEREAWEAERWSFVSEIEHISEEKDNLERENEQLRIQNEQLSIEKVCILMLRTLLMRFVSQKHLTYRINAYRENDIISNNTQDLFKNYIKQTRFKNAEADLRAIEEARAQKEKVFCCLAVMLSLSICGVGSNCTSARTFVHGTKFQQLHCAFHSTCSCRTAWSLNDRRTIAHYLCFGINSYCFSFTSGF